VHPRVWTGSVCRVGLRVVTGHRLEELFEALCADLAHDPLPPLATETVLVPGQGIGRWLQLQLADRFGIAAGYRLPFVSSWLTNLGEATDAVDPFRRDVLVLRILRVLESSGGRHEAEHPFGPAAAYIADDPTGQKRLQLAERLAATFESYQLSRPELLRAFAAGDERAGLGAHAPWQSRLWRALLEDAGLRLERPRPTRRREDKTGLLFAEPLAPREPRTAVRLDRLAGQLEDEAFRTKLPVRLAIFGVATLPPPVLGLLQKLARHRPVNLYVPQPTPHFVGHLRSRGDARGDNLLLSRWGQESREFADLLLELEPATADDAPVEHHSLDADGPPTDPPKHLLACVQRDLVEAADRRTDEADAFVVRRDDDSLRIHDCHSPRRELEIVRDQIFAAFAHDPSLEPRDVLVLVPDIDAYAPIAAAVFGPVADHVPFHIADRSPARELPLCRALLRVLELERDRVQRDDVLHLLDVRAVQQRFGIAANEVEPLRRLVDAAAIRWGLDGQHRSQRYGLPADDANAWLPGLDRLVLGTLTGPADDLCRGILPVADVTDSRRDLLRRFLVFTDALFAAVAGLRDERPFVRWAEALEATIAALFATTHPEDEHAARQLRQALANLRTTAAAAAHEAPVTLPALRDWLRDALAQGAGAHGFLGGAVTIAAMRPMRAVPVRCLFVCGLDDTSFPRRDAESPFDLAAAERRPGDRSQRLDDRQLMLDLVLAARERLHLTFVGRSSKDNSTASPSQVLVDLCTHLEATCRLAGGGSLVDHLVVRHPLQAWSARYDGDDARLFTFTRACLPPRAGLAPEAPFVPAEPVLRPAPVGDTILPLESLLAFWNHPCRAFLRETLDLRVRDLDEHDPADEPFETDHLTRFLIMDELVERARQGQPLPRDPVRYLAASGRVPPSHWGNALLFDTVLEATQFLRAPGLVEPVRARAIDLVVAGVRILGELPEVGAEHMTCARITRLKPKTQLRAWILHLLLLRQARASNGGWPRTTHLYHRDGIATFTEVADDIVDAQLELLLRSYEQGLTRPLPWFEKASYECGERLHKKRDGAAALRSAMSFYHGSTRAQAQADSADPDIALCMRGTDPFADGERSEFYRLATAIWPVVIGHRYEGRA
jgi:exodeoxyribonuclease V gamma subunit